MNPDPVAILDQRDLLAAAEWRITTLEATLRAMINIDMKKMREDFDDEADHQFRMWAQNRARVALGLE